MPSKQLSRFLAAGMMLAASFFAHASGQDLYDAKCAGCHSLNENRVGPKHIGLKNRLVGSVADYSYSSALEKAGKGKRLRWNAESLDQWLIDPETYLPGQAMNYSLKNAEDRRVIIEYLLNK
jgi:cytochrome c